MSNKAVIYIRVSSDKQVGNDHYSIECQENKCVDYCRYKSLDIKSIHKDEGISGTSLSKRVGLRSAIDELEENDTLVVYSISRLSRNMHDFSKILHEFEEKHLNLASTSESFDSGTPMGRLVMNILGSFSQFESQSISKRTSDVMKYQKSIGRRFGRAPYGYKYDNDKLEQGLKGVITEDIYEQEIVKIIIKIKEEGLDADKKYASIARFLNSESYHKRNLKPWDGQTVKNIWLNFESVRNSVNSNNKIVNSRGVEIV